MITIFMDGSAIKQDPAKHEYVLSWGMVANHDDQTTEKFGHFNNVPMNYNIFHETVAFIEAMRYAKGRGFAFNEMSFYTDDLLLTHAGFMLHPGNFVATEDVHRLKKNIARLCTRYYDDATYCDAVECLSTARFTKVKGHQRTIYNLRADYLARHAHQLVLETADPLLPFEVWLGTISRQSSDPMEGQWRPHFSKPEEAEPSYFDGPG
jgi:ribonuclease HI